MNNPQKYRIRVNSADAFGPWVDGAEFAATMAEAKKIRTRIARAVGLPTSAVEINRSDDNGNC